MKIPATIKAIVAASADEPKQIQFIKEAYPRLRKTKNPPSVTIVIPAYNEEKNILTTLHSIVANQTDNAVEIIVINNNSTDRTQWLVEACGVPCIVEKTKDITAARNAGLTVAKGNYILNANSDTIYPGNWIDTMISPLERDAAVAMTYGRFSFVPCGKTKRWLYFFYEHLADIPHYFNKYFKEEAVNVGGCNSAFRRLQGLWVDSFNHPDGANEDGYLALKLRRQFGKLYLITDHNALVWKTDRRIEMEGGMLKGLQKRIKKFFFPSRFVQLHTDL